jgi:hypothetical protein
VIGSFPCAAGGQTNQVCEFIESKNRFSHATDLVAIRECPRAWTPWASRMGVVVFGIENMEMENM